MKCIGVSSVRADDNGVGAELKAERCRGEQPGKGEPEGGMVFHAYLELELACGPQGSQGHEGPVGLGHVNNWFDSCRGFYLSLDAGKSGRPTGSASSHPSSSRASYQTSPIPVKPASAILIMSQPRGP